MNQGVKSTGVISMETNFKGYDLKIRDKDRIISCKGKVIIT